MNTNKTAVSLSALAEIHGVALVAEKRKKDVIESLRQIMGTPAELKAMTWFARLDQVLVKSDEPSGATGVYTKYGYYAIGNGSTKKEALQDLAAQLSGQYVYVRWEEVVLPKLKA